MSTTRERLSQLYRENLDTGREPDLDLGFGDPGLSRADVVAFIKLVAGAFGVTIDRKTSHASRLYAISRGT